MFIYYVLSLNFIICFIYSICYIFNVLLFNLFIFLT